MESYRLSSRERILRVTLNVTATQGWGRVCAELPGGGRLRGTAAGGRIHVHDELPGNKPMPVSFQGEVQKTASLLQTFWSLGDTVS